jgi:hypothetical protein
LRISSGEFIRSWGERAVPDRNRNDHHPGVAHRRESTG